MKITIYRPMPYLTAAFGLGCLLAFVGKILFQIHWILGSVIPILLLQIGWLLRIRFSISVPFGRNKKNDDRLFSEEMGKRYLLWGMYGLLWIGMIRSGVLYSRESRIDQQENYLSSVLCEVESKDKASFGSYQYVISSRDFSGKVLIYLSQSFEIGDTFLSDLSLTRIHHDGNPGEFDQVSYQRVRGIYYQGKAYHVEPQEIEKRKDNLGSFRRSIQRELEHLRQSLILRLQMILPEKEAGFLSAMLLGEDSFLDPELKTAFRSAGISHLLVISGLHLGILYSLLQSILSRIKNVRWQTNLTVLILGGYVLLTGAALSTLRAWIFCSITCYQKRGSGKVDRINTLFLTALLLLIWNPLNLLDTGFQLSFGCVLGISALRRWETFFLGIRKKPRKAFFSMLSVNLISLPLSIWYFGNVSPYQFLLNLILIPAMSILVPFAFLILVFSAFWVQGAMAGALVFSDLFQLVIRLIQAALQLPYSVLSIPRPPLAVMILYGLLLLFWYRLGCVPQKKSLIGFESHSKSPFPGSVKITRQRVNLCFTLGILLAMVLIWIFQPRTRVTFLNVGQGDCCVVENEGRVFLVDAGPHYSKAIRPYLVYRGITRIDGILVSHFDKDHIESLESLLNEERLQVERIFLPLHAIHENAKQEKILKLAEEKGIRIQYLQSGMEYTSGSCTWQCLSPDPQMNYSDENSASMVLLLEMEGKRFLFCGDSDLESEEIYSALLSGPVDVVKAGHHGSSSSSGDSLLQRAMPRDAVISCELGNSYGHPHAETLRRYNQMKTELLITYEKGAVQYLKGLFGWSRIFGKSI